MKLIWWETNGFWIAQKTLEKGDAEIIALTAATMHVVYDKLKPQVNKPFISIPEAAAEYAVSKGYKKVGLLGTVFTMENGIEAIILGCTELSLALNKENCPVDCLGIMEIHIQKLVDLLK